MTVQTLEQDLTTRFSDAVSLDERSGYEGYIVKAEKLIEFYGEEKGKSIKAAEAFELCEYGQRPSIDDLKKLFPF